MVQLEMTAFAMTSGEKAPKGHSTWWLGNDQDVTFPDNDKIIDLWREHAPGLGEMTVVGSYGPNHVIVRIPIGSNPRLRAGFVEAVSEECSLA